MKKEQFRQLLSGAENKKEKKIFKPLSFWRELLLKEDELVEYYNSKRKYEYEHKIPMKGMKFRDILHPILLKLIELNRKFITKQTITILNDPRKKSDKPVIYAFTHIGMYDVQIFSEAIKDHQYIFAGDPETMYRSFDGVLFALNGVVYCDTESREDRIIATETAKEVLKSGKNLTIAPEGVWNLTPNLLSLPLYPGVIKLAMETGCEIVPVAVEQYGNDFFVNIGENINVTPDRELESEEEKKAYIEERKDELRDVFATLKWEIIEKYAPKIKERTKGATKEEIEAFSYEEEYDKFVRTRLEEWKNPKTKETYYTKEKVNARTFRPKGIHFFSEVFAHLKKIKLSESNKFLFADISDLPKDIREEMQEEVDKFDQDKVKVR